MDEHDALEAIQRRASLALDEFRDVLQANPDAFGIPAGQIERGDVFVAEVEGLLAGFAALEGGELDGLFVEPDLWRQGIGSGLVEAAVHEARRRGLSLVTVVANIWVNGIDCCCRRVACAATGYPISAERSPVIRSVL